MKKEMVIFNVTPINTDVTDLAAFEKKVARAAKAGATHITVTELPKSRWIWDADRSDPYPNWGMLNPSLFKIIVPEQLRQWLPTDYAENNLRLVAARCEIIKKYGLRAAAYFCEPFYLPEAVYRAHPDWRGPRCDHPRRAKNYYYSPCMDNPEVLAMYRDAMKKLCDVAPLDYVYLHTNDCGGGICWSSGLYDGANGPESCRNIPLADRILGYFRVFREGAADAGRSIYIETNSNIGFKENEHVMDTVWPLLEDGMAVNFKDNRGQPLSSLVDTIYEYTYSPVRCIPMFGLFLEQLQRAYEDKSKILKFIITDDDFDEYNTIIELFNAKHTKTAADRYALLRRVAAGIAGDKCADTLVQAWLDTETARLHYFDTCIEGFSWTGINQRLLNRPFVLFPEELTEEQTAYFRPFQFQAVDEAHARDLLDNQCTSFVRGSYASFIALNCLKRAEKLWSAAMNAYKRVAAAQSDSDRAAALDLVAQRYELLLCVSANYRHAIEFQLLVDEADYEKTPEISSRWPLDADPALLRFEAVNRAEIDNTYHIISLIKGREKQMLSLSPTPEQEDIFWLCENITEQLKMKAEIMLDHQLDGKRLWETHNH